MAQLILLPGKERSSFKRHPWLFAGSVGRTDFPYGSHEQLIEAIRTKLLVLPDVPPLTVSSSLLLVTVQSL